MNGWNDVLICVSFVYVIKSFSLHKGGRKTKNKVPLGYIDYRNRSRLQMVEAVRFYMKWRNGVLYLVLFWDNIQI